MKEFNILGVKVSDTTMEEVLNTLYNMLRDDRKHFIATPNPEFIVSASSNPLFKKILNSTDFNVPDGRGLLFAAKFINEVNKLPKEESYIIRFLKVFIIGVKVGFAGFLHPKYLDCIRQTVSGADLVTKIMEVFERKSCSVYIVGTKYLNDSESGVEALKVLKKRYQGVNFVGSVSGREQVSSSDFQGVSNSVVLDAMLTDTKKAGLKSVDFVFVAFGHIRQELWISENINSVPGHIMLGVGGSFDYITGRQTRAPRIVRKIGLEWIFRIISRPSLDRMKRIVNASIYFPWLVFKSVLIMKQKY